MDIRLLVEGLIIGFSIAAPVGPIGVLCIRRTLAQGQIVGLVSGLGAATADLIYGCLAGLGLTLISNVLSQQQHWLRLVGGLFLVYLGVRTFLTQPAAKAAQAQGRGLIGAYGSTLALTLTNPMTILSFAAILAGAGIGQSESDYLSVGVFVLGVFVGSALWWLTLSAGVGLLRSKMTPMVMQWVNRVSGAIIALFGAIALWGLLKG
ncbi:MAG: LysE family transporter [Anaerolineae bacterium]|nr:LysE family transporter [Anaerolineae bacterium]